ncbi:MAG: hypothetical protein MUF59_07175 [Candidatus Krumholzibacteria bacterium]|nr:hypothetical protein [Candidatus Krumholzibacteria bacterium]
MDLLFAAAKNIHSSVAPPGDRPLAGTDLTAIESSLENDLKTVFLHLYALTKADLRIRSDRDGLFFLRTVSWDFDDIAWEAAEIPFESRCGNGLLEVVDMIARLFTRETEPTREDLFLHLKGVASTNLTQMIKRIYRLENRPMHYVYSAVTKHVTAGEAYSREGNRVRPAGMTDSDGGPGASAIRREVTVEEIVSLCSGDVGGSDTPGRIVDIIFDRLAGHPKFSPSLGINTLRHAVFTLIKSRFVPAPGGTPEADPMEKYYRAEMLRLGEITLAETVESYGWREGGSGEFRELFEKTARDLLSEAIISGTMPPFHEAIGRYQVDYSREKYEKTHKGSFQSFWNVLRKNFLKIIRARS